MRLSIKMLLSFSVLVLLASCSRLGGGVDDPGTFTLVPSSTTVSLSWTPVSGATGYILERKEGSNFVNLINGENKTSYSDGGLNPSTNYTYRVKTLKDATPSAGVTKSTTTRGKGTAADITTLKPIWRSKEPVNLSPGQNYQGREVSLVKNAVTNVVESGSDITMTRYGDIMYYLGGSCTEFTATASGSGTFRVVADDKLLWSGTGNTLNTGTLNLVSAQTLSLVYQDTSGSSGTWTKPTIYCDKPPAALDADTSPFVKGRWGPVFDWGDKIARGTPGDPRNPGFYERGLIVPTHVANLPDGSIVSWAAWREFTYGRKTETVPFIDQTAGFVWNPKTGTGTTSFRAADNPTHDMFCAGLALMADGRVFAAGGGSTNPGGAPAPSQYKASFFDFRNGGRWTESTRPGGGNAFSVDHWYPSAVAIPNSNNTPGNSLFVVGGSGGNNLPNSVEVLGANDATWKTLSGADNMFSLSDSDTDIGTPVAISGEQVKTLEWGEVRGWYPFLNVAPDGSLFQSGPQPRLKKITVGTGAVNVDSSAGLPSSHALMRTWGNSIMFDEGKILVSGGSVIRGYGGSSTAMVIDINKPVVDVQVTPDMRFRRSYQNTVVLPTGDVLIVGGNNSGKQFTDGSPLDPDGYLDTNPAAPANTNFRWPTDIWTETVFTPELYSPDKNSWRDLADMKEARNYHAVGILLQDGRVLAAGGGLCGDDPAGDDATDCNHPNGEVFEPPYLFNEQGNLANRPVINGLGAGASTNQDAPGTFDVTLGATFNVQLSTLGDGSKISKFSMIKLSAVTHNINTDVRYLEYSGEKNNLSGTGNDYQLTLTSNKNVLTPGYYFLFALNDKGVPSEGLVVQVN